MEAIKTGLERDGMADIADEIRDAGDGGSEGAPQPRTLHRRDTFRNLRIYLPIVNWVDGNTIRPLDYDRDILFRLDWSSLRISDVADKLVAVQQTQKDQTVKVGLTDDPDARGFLEIKDPEETPVRGTFDAVYAVRSVSDLLPNPWLARSIIGDLLEQLTERGLSTYQIGGRTCQVIETLRVHLRDERDRLAEELFMDSVQEGSIQFHLRTDRNDWEMPSEMTTLRSPDSQQLYRDDGKIVENSIFSPVYRDDFSSDYERRVACYLDGYKALRWWHRNVARHQYAIQGWRKQKVYPDFIFAMTADDKKERFYVLETKGDQLAGNLDTKYKQKLLELCNDAFELEKISPKGELELVGKDGKTVSCAMIFEETWKTDIAQVLPK